MTRKMEKALNAQLNAEAFSAYLYLAMEGYFHSVNLPGFANWMRVQAQEELFHVTKFFDYINERRGRVTLEAIEKPPASWKSPLTVFQAAFKHEQKVSGLINDLVDLALKEKDNATYNFLQWFVSEQVEEEASVDAIVQKLTLVGDNGAGMFMVDQELVARVFTPPATA